MSQAGVFWFTGLSGSGKTTVARGTARLLEKENFNVLILDGDEVRRNYHRDLGFSEEDIKLNNRLIVGLCKKKLDQFDVIFVPIISPYRDSREHARRELKEIFYEIYFSAGLDTVMQRDKKGLYRKAQRGELKNMIGFSPGSPYEAPQNADLEILSLDEPGSLEACVQKFFKFVCSHVHRQHSLQEKDHV